MRANLINKEHFEGYLYEHSLAIKEVANRDSENFGKKFINGTLSLATDEDCLNIVTINFTYVTPMTKTNKVNSTYTVLEEVINSGKTVITDGKDAAMKLKIDCALGVNDYYSDRSGEEKLYSIKKNEGRFVTKITKINPEDTNSFKVDMLILSVNEVEANEERNIPEDYVVIKGAIFDFKNSILPVDFICKSKGGMRYFTSLNATEKNPVFTNVWGYVNSETVINNVVTESAFGEPEVRPYSRSIKEWIVKGAAKETYEYGNPETGITMEEILAALAKRETDLADIKKKKDDYQASKNNSNSVTVNSTNTAISGWF